MSDGEQKKKITDFTLRYWRPMIQVFAFNISFCFDMLMCFFFHHLGKIIIKQLIRAELLLLDREINNTNTYLQHQHFKVLQYACKIRTCITSSLGQRCSCQSNQVSQVYTPRPNLFSFCVTYLRGKYILLFFSFFFSSSLLCWNKDLSFKRKRFGGYDPRSQREVVTTHRDHCLHIVYLYSLHTLYTVTSKRAVERRAPQCWCSMGKTPFTVRVLQLVQDAGRSSAIGSVWAWIKAVTETGISDFCLCAAGLRALKGSLFPFSSLLVFFFFFFRHVSLRLCTSWNVPLPPCWCRVRGVRLIQWAQAIWVCGNVQFSGSRFERDTNIKTKINTASTKRHPGHSSTPLDGGSRRWGPEMFQL